MKHISELKKEHYAEEKDFRENCPHLCVRVVDYSNFHYGRTVDLVCVVCETTIVSWDGAKDPDYSQPDRGRITVAHNFIKETEATKKSMDKALAKAIKKTQG